MPQLKMNISEFEKQIKQAAVKLDREWKDAFRSFISATFIRVVERTPVKTGRLAGSWDLTTGSKGSFYIPRGEASSGAEAIARVTGKINSGSPYKKWYIYNNAEQAMTVEYGLFDGEGPNTVDGFSRQAPAGMLRVTIEEMRLQLRGIISGGIR